MKFKSTKDPLFVVFLCSINIFIVSGVISKIVNREILKK